MRILIADDNRINREFLKGVLAEPTFDIAEAADGREAVALFAEDAFELVLMDLRMPEMDGLEATRAIRAMNTDPRPTIVALTADLQIQQKTGLLQQGFDACMSKPVSRQSLLELTARLAPRNDPLTDPGGPVPAEGDLIDDAAAMAAAGGNRELLDRLLGMLGRELQTFLPQIRDQAANGQYEPARELTHKLRGSAGYTGAVQLQAAAAELELALTRGVAPEIEVAVEHLDKAARQLEPLLPR